MRSNVRVVKIGGLGEKYLFLFGLPGDATPPPAGHKSASDRDTDPEAGAKPFLYTLPDD
jgi:hypothetical protein